MIFIYQITKAVKLQTDEDFYPMWTSAEIVLNVDGPSQKMQYKFVKIQEDKVSTSSYISGDGVVLANYSCAQWH